MQKKQKFLQKSFILIYVLEIIAFLLHLVMVIRNVKTAVYDYDFDWANFFALILIVFVYSVMIIYNFCKYYIFFVKSKLSQIKNKKKCTWLRFGVLFWHTLMIIILVWFVLILITEFAIQAFNIDNFKQGLLLTAELHKTAILTFLHLNSFTILLIYFYVALNQ